MEENIYQLSRENFHFLMDCINEYCDRSAPPRNGLLYFIRNSLIAERVVTKYQPTTIEYFKAFFCNEVLELHKFREEINIAEYEKYFDDRSGKKNDLSTENMNRYLDRRENLNYIRETLSYGDDTEEFTEVIPVLLLDRLQKVAHWYLKTYFLLDEEKFEKKKSMRLDRRQITDYVTAKKKLYRKFVCAACLYEIFADKFIGNEVCERFVSSMREMLETVMNLQETQKQICDRLNALAECKKEKALTDEIRKETEHLTDWVAKFKEEVVPILDKANMTAAGAYFHMVHAKYINALYAVISMVEFTNVNTKDYFEIPKKWRQPEMFEKMEDLFAESACKSLFIDDISMNKNYCDVYGRAMEGIAEEKIIKELCSKSRKTQEKALTFISLYFSGVLTGADQSDENFSAALSVIFRKSLEE